jgi:hypothetical protein
MTPNTSNEGESLKMLRIFVDQALVEHPATCEHNFYRAIARKRLDFLRNLAPQAGFEPATLRLTGEPNDVSRPLPGCAGRCRISHGDSKNSPLSDLRFVPPLAAVYSPLLRSKGNKRATSHSSARWSGALRDKWWALTVDPVMEQCGPRRRSPANDNQARPARRDQGPVAR